MRLLSTRELSDAIGVSESSLKRWIDAGKITASRTHGGHRRIALPDALRFIRDQRARLVRPELLGVAEVHVARTRGQPFATYLLDGDHAAARGFLIGHYLEGATVAELADGPIRDGMRALGELWQHDEAGIAIEHRGTDVCTQAVAQLHGLIPDPPARAPVAIGGAPSEDPYLLPSLLASLTLREAGVNAINLGPDTPTTALDAAIARYRPRLVWLSVSTPLSPERGHRLASWLGTVPRSIACVIGGAQVHTVAPSPRSIHRLSSMAQLASYTW